MINGVLSFEHFYAVVEAHFPEGKARCINCTYYNDRTRRCSLTQDVCVEPEKYRHWSCPLIEKAEKHDD